MSHEKRSGPMGPEAANELHEKAMRLIHDIKAFARENDLNWSPCPPRSCSLHQSIRLAYNFIIDLRTAAEANGLKPTDSGEATAEELGYFGESLVSQMQEISDAIETLDCADCQRATLGTTIKDPRFQELMEISEELLRIRLEHAAGRATEEDAAREEKLKEREAKLRQAVLDKGRDPQENN